LKHLNYLLLKPQVCRSPILQRSAEAAHAAQQEDSLAFRSRIPYSLSDHPKPDPDAQHRVRMVHPAFVARSLSTYTSGGPSKSKIGFQQINENKG
jgi:hypothetical protein